MWLGTCSRLRGARGEQEAEITNPGPVPAGCCARSGSLHASPGDVLGLLLSLRPCPSPGEIMDSSNPQIASFFLAQGSCKRAGGNGGGGAPTGSQRELGCPRSLPASVTSTSRCCYLPDLISRAAPLICPSQPRVPAPRQARLCWLSGEPFPELMQMILIKGILICSISHTFCLGGG